MIIVNRLKELRLERGLLQSDIAKIINKSERTVGFYETGERDMGTETLAILSDFLNVSIDYLLGKSNIRNPEKLDKELLDIGLSKKDYNPPTKEQQEKIEEFARFVLKDNLKKKEDK
ncbi:MAG TPA: helix-turn-helix domain-containing protein [Clostridiaceae bacterium]|jgi:transcriptional regulator with XRE-family HTH domain|nr:MAG TPA: Helix-turn-helix XRE-family like protein [Caudoviricetes sp.]HJJ19209.1 helix-turn-helix domain-containing protein [Clostridiaceae bacterium]